jgi:imidazolonepropionase-like amidohydrolase/Tol biopolymer transport system component
MKKRIRVAYRVKLLGAATLSVIGFAAWPTNAQEVDPLDLEATALQAFDTLRTIEFETTEVTAPHVTVSPDGETLVFTMLGHLFQVPVEGGDAVQLTFGPYLDTEPAYSPDGRSIAFVSDRDGGEGNVFIFDLAGDSIWQLTNEPWAGEPVWSPDGRRLAYRSFVMQAYRGRMGQYVPAVLKEITVPEGKARTVVPDTALVRAWFYMPDGRPAWAPDGVWRAPRRVTPIVALGDDGMVDTVATLDGEVAAVYAPANGERLFYHRRLIRQSFEGLSELAWISSPLDGSTERFVTFVVDGAYPGGLPPPSHTAVSPDGRSFYVGTGGRLWSIRLTDGVRRPIPFRVRVRLTVHPSVVPPPRRLAEPGESVRPRAIGTPVITPVGGAIVFVLAGDLWLQEIGGATARRLTDSEWIAHSPAVDPDGQHVAYVATRSGRHELRVLDLSTGRDETLVARDERIGQPAWSPDGTNLVFWSPGVRGVDRVDLATRDIDRLARTAERHLWRARPHYSANGEWVYYTAVSTGTGSLWRVRVGDSASAEALTNLDRHMSDGVVSASGEWLVFRRGTEIWTARMTDAPITEEDVRRLTRTGGDNFSLTPDGDGVVYSVGDRVWQRTLPEGEPTEIRLDVQPGTGAPDATVLRNVRPLDLDAGAFGAPVDLFIRGGRIVHIGPQGTLAPEGASIIDGEGRFAIPGLFDMHVHVSTRTTGEGLLAWGITSVREVGNAIRWLETLADRSELTAAPEPRYFYAGGLFMGARPSPEDEEVQLHDPDEAKKYVAEWKSRGAHWIKTYQLDYVLDTRPWWLARAVAEEARRVRIPVAGHGMSAEEIVKHVAVGYASLEHTSGGERVYEDILGLMSAADVRWDPTLGAAGGWALLLREAPERLDVERLKAFASLAALDAGTNALWYRPTNALRGWWLDQLASVREAYERGIRLLVGTDVRPFGSGPKGLGGATLHWELEHFAEAGIANAEVLKIATLGAAEALGVDGDLGSLTVGKLADIVLLDADPLKDIRNTQSIWRVIKGGRLFDPEELAAEARAVRQR